MQRPLAEVRGGRPSAGSGSRWRPWPLSSGAAAGQVGNTGKVTPPSLPRPVGLPSSLDTPFHPELHTLVCPLSPPCFTPVAFTLYF